MTLAELKELDFRNGMEDYNLDDDTRIPTLEEFFDWFVETDLLINLELKTSMYRYQGLVEKVIDMVKKYDLVDRVIISSFNHRDVVLAKEICPEIKCGFLTYSVFYDPAIYTKDHGIDYYHPDFNAMDKEDWDQCNEYGIGTLPYTIDDPDDMKKMVEEKVKYIITNDAQTAVKVLGR